MPKSTAANYGDTLRKYADEFFAESGAESAGSGDIAMWAIQTGRWEPPHDVVFKLCREHFARAMREDYTTDSNGRPVRLKHAARVKRGDEQLTLWADIRKAPREHMVAAFQQRRQQIVGDCCQLKAGRGVLQRPPPGRRTAPDDLRFQRGRGGSHVRRDRGGMSGLPIAATAPSVVRRIPHLAPAERRPPMRTSQTTTHRVRVRPRVTPKALAEFSQRQVHEQIALLTGQKFPDREESAFKGSAYSSAKAAARGYYLAENPLAFLRERKGRVERLPKMRESQKAHELRAIAVFQNTPEFSRRGFVAVRPAKDYVRRWCGVAVKFRPDVEAVTADGRVKFISLHCPTDPIPAELARRRLELTLECLTGCEAPLKIAPGYEAVELFCLSSGTLHTLPREPRVRTVRRAEKDLKLMVQLWPSVV